MFVIVGGVRRFCYGRGFELYGYSAVYRWAECNEAVVGYHWTTAPVHLLYGNMISYAAVYLINSRQSTSMQHRISSAVD